MQRFFNTWRAWTGQRQQQAEPTTSSAITTYGTAVGHETDMRDSGASAQRISVPHPQQEHLIRQRAANKNPTAAIYHVPATMPMSDLYNPIMVKITVRDSGDSETFTVPRGLITNKSEYFNRAFKSGFQEAEKGEIELKDVPPTTFRVFVGWLYTGRVFLSTEDHQKTSMSGAISGRKRKFGDVDGGDGQSDPPRAAPALRETAPLESPPSPYYPPSSPEYDSQVFPDGSPRQDRADDQEVDEEDDEPLVYENPLTWPWKWLFSLFILADRCDTRELRMLVLDLIELKLYCHRPRRYLRPSNNDIWLLYDNLPASSSLRRTVVHCFAKDMPLSEDGDSKDEQAKSYEGLPHAFLLETLLAAKAHMYATRCSARVRGRCMCGGDLDHEEWEAGAIPPTCTFHEHGRDEEEKKLCYEKWGALWAAYCG